MRIYIIGMPLSGKTTIGKKLAETLNFSFLDLDEEIEKNENISIEKLFKNDQEYLFRTLETKALKKCLSYNQTVISTGGGVVVNPQNISLLDGVVVFLDVRLGELEKRQKSSYHRPLLAEKSLATLYSERIKKYYEIADIISQKLDVDEIITIILEELKDKVEL